MRQRGGNDTLPLALGFQDGFEIVFLGDGDHITIIELSLIIVNQNPLQSHRGTEKSARTLIFLCLGALFAWCCLSGLTVSALAP